MPEFVFDGDAVLQLLLIVSGIASCFAAVGVVVFLATRVVVKRDCSFPIDDDGARNGRDH